MSAGVELGANRYGKSRIRLVKVLRSPERNEILDWTVEVLLEGDFEAAHTLGDNSRILPTDTMKNTVYSLARTSFATTLEAFARELASFLLSRNPQVSAAEVSISSALWKHLSFDEEEDRFSFMRGNDEVQTARVRHEQGGRTETASGLAGMVVLKTTRSSFAGFLRDSLTTLPETGDRLMGSAVSASWTYTHDPRSFPEARTALREAMLRTFAEHESKSVQHTLYAMGEAALHVVPEIDAIEITMPNRHCLLVDLSRFGQDNPNEIFVPTDEPHGTIYAQVRRKQA